MLNTRSRLFRPEELLERSAEDIQGERNLSRSLNRRFRKNSKTRCVWFLLLIRGRPKRTGKPGRYAVLLTMPVIPFFVVRIMHKTTLVHRLFFATYNTLT